MKPNSERVKEIFAQALAKTAPGEREQFLAAACEGEPDLRQQIETLLRADGAAGAFMGQTMKLPPGSFPTEQAGAVIGRYKLLQQIGEGGCGVVYMAEQQEPVRRRVALKVIKLGMDTKEVIARFEAERQALALMDHPNIAKVLDAGATETGRPYFVMELVKGIPITRFCDENNLSTASRLDLFIQVCHAIQHAHQKGIIHRDIKPSNVLVADHDGVPVPKIIDFGIAKATTDQRLTDKTLFTAFEQFIGTPAYMSPEQAKLSGLDIDTRSDIYSLGVLLYELLTGKTPFESDRLHEAGLDEIRRIIREEEPLRPSTRLHTLDAAEQTTVASHRQSDPPKLAHLISGDLDWIVMKALEKERGRRYETANGLAMDVQRHLNNEPIVARPAGNLYRLQRMYRRNKVVFSAVAAVAAALLLGLGMATVAFLRERQARASEGRMLYVANMSLAQPAWDQNNIGLLDQLLGQTQSFPDRGFEWYYWQRQTHLALQTLRGHTSSVTSVGYSPNGQRIVTGSFDSTARVWDAASGRVLLTFKGHANSPVTSVAFSPDGRKIVAGSWDGTAKVWDAASGRVLLTIQGHSGQIYAAAFSPDGLWIATGGQDQMATVWDAASGQKLLTLKGHQSWVVAVAFSPDGRRILTGSYDGSAKLWDTASGTNLLTLPAHYAPIYSAAFSRDGKRIVTGGADRMATVWDAASGKELRTLKGHTDNVLGVAFSPDGGRIATASADRAVKVWDAASGDELLTLKEHTAGVTGVAFSPDGKRILTASTDETAKVWDATTDRTPLTLRGHTSFVTSLAFSPDSQRIVTGSTDKTAKVWEAASGRELLTLKGHTELIQSVAFSPDGQRILTGSDDHTGRIWDAASGHELLALQAGTNQIRSVAWSPDGRRIVTGNSDGTGQMWDAASGRELFSFKEDYLFCVAAWSPDSKRIVTGSFDATVQVRDASDGHELLTLKRHEGSTLSAAFSQDGTKIVTGNGDQTATVWDAASGKVWLILKGHNNQVCSVAFSPDGRRILTGSQDHTAKLWDTATGRELLTFKGHEGGFVSSVAFSPDGLRIATGSWDNTAKVWEAASKGQVAQWQEEEDAAENQFLAQMKAEGRPVKH